MGKNKHYMAPNVGTKPNQEDKNGSGKKCHQKKVIVVHKDNREEQIKNVLEGLEPLQDEPGEQTEDEPAKPDWRMAMDDMKAELLSIKEMLTAKNGNKANIPTSDEEIFTSDEDSLGFGDVKNKMNQTKTQNRFGYSTRDRHFLTRGMHGTGFSSGADNRTRVEGTSRSVTDRVNHREPEHGADNRTRLQGVRDKPQWLYDDYAKSDWGHQTNRRATDFDIHRESGSIAYYRLFPQPWDVAPGTGGTKDCMAMLQGLSKGIIDAFEEHNPNDYARWRSQVISFVHLSSASVQSKITAVASLLSKEVKNNLEVTIDYSPIGYLNLITALEDSFGGPRRLLNAASHEVKQLEMLKPDRLGDLQHYVRVINTYFQRLEEAGLQRDIHTMSCYNDIVEPWPWTYHRDYRQWVEQTQAEESAVTALDWAKRLLNLLRRIPKKERLLTETRTTKTFVSEAQNDDQVKHVNMNRWGPQIRGRQSDPCGDRSRLPTVQGEGQILQGEDIAEANDKQEWWRRGKINSEGKHGD